MNQPGAVPAAVGALSDPMGASIEGSCPDPTPGAPIPSYDPTRKFATLTFMRGALIAMGVTLVAGTLAAFYSIPSWAPWFQSLGIDLRQLRPLHTTFAAAWIFLGAAAVVHHFLQSQGGPPTAGDRWRLRIQVLAWAVAGAGILVTLSVQVGSGREYMGFHPAFSVLILLGWVCYTWNFYRVTWRSFWTQPVYVTMWGVGLLFFMYTFVEQHAYLLPGIFADPLQDMRIQWKATGTLVGSFNLFVYGSAYYVGEKLSGDGRYAHSRTAYALLAVGLLNSFTNFGHHTYHLPQRAAVNWISFVVSMTEIVILARVMWELGQLVIHRAVRLTSPCRASLLAGKWWTLAILFSAILISFPPLNSLIHGTYVVPGHAMGAMIGIDTMILLGAFFWMLGELCYGGADPIGEARLRRPGLRRIIIGLNLAVAALVGWLHVSGLVTGITRARLGPGEAYLPPPWIANWNGVLLATTGTLTLIFFTALLATLIPITFRRRAHQS